MLQGSIALAVASVLVLGYTILFTTTIDQGDFHHAADYWLPCRARRPSARA